MNTVSPPAHTWLIGIGDNLRMRSFTVTENGRRMHPVEPDPFIALPTGDRTLPPRPPSSPQP